MAHIHAVIDSDKHFVIDPVTRQAFNSSTIIRLMQNDHNSERLTFEIPRYIDGHDMSLCNRVEVHYLNTDGAFVNDGVYEVDDLHVSTESDNVVICSWLISQNVTKYTGAVSFVIRYACVVDGVTVYQWHTDVHDRIMVYETINNAEVVVTEYSDILEQWREQLFNNIDASSGSNVFVATYGKTTNSEIFEAFDAGKVCFVKQGGAFFPSSGNITTGLAFFSGVYRNVLVDIVCHFDEWSRTNRSEVTEITSESTHEQRPTAKAVYDLVSEHAGGSGGNVDKVTLTSSDGSKWRLTVDNSGNVGAVKVASGDSGTEEPDIPDIPGATTYTVTSGLTYVESTNPSAVVNEGASYTATLTAMDGYDIDSVVVTMGGVDITATTYNAGVINIANVTGNVVITAIATAVPEYKNITWCATAYSVGATTTRYNGWIPHNLQYDEVNNKFLLLGCHRAAHTGAFSNITLHELDAKDPTKQTELNVPTYAALGSLLVDNGVWYIYSRLKYIRYKSADMGKTWVEEAITVNEEPYWFGIFKVNNKYFGCTDAYWNKYFISDDGINWSSCSFGINDGDPNAEFAGKEGGFAYFNGFYYAFLRSDTIQYARIYKSVTAESNSWVLVNEDTIPSYQTCPMPIVYKDRIACVTTNRGDGHLYYCFVSETDEIEVIDMGLRSVNPNAFGDFITANIAYDGENAIIAYCTMSSFDDASTNNYQTCETVALYGTVGNVNNIPVVKETQITLTNTEDGLADLASLGVTIYPEGAVLEDGALRSTVNNKNDFNVFAVLPSDWLSKKNHYAYFPSYHIKDGKVALPAAQWGAWGFGTTTAFNANTRFAYLLCLDIDGVNYIYCNRQGQNTLFRRESFAYGPGPEGCPVTENLTRVMYFPANTDNIYVLFNTSTITVVTRE